MTTTRLIAALIALLAIAALSAIVLVAIGLNRLGDLIGGIAVSGALVVIGLLVIVLLIRVASVPLSRIWDARLAIQKEANRHDEKYLEKGYVREDSGYKPTIPQIAAPQAKQGAISQIIFNPNALRESAVNLLLFSMRQYGADQNRIASGPDCAAAGVNGYTPRTWSKIVKEFLEPRYGVVTQRGNPDSGGGTYVPTEIGTVEALYNRVMTDSAVDDLPGVTR